MLAARWRRIVYQGPVLFRPFSFADKALDSYKEQAIISNRCSHVMEYLLTAMRVLLSASFIKANHSPSFAAKSQKSVHRIYLNYRVYRPQFEAGFKSWYWCRLIYHLDDYQGEKRVETWKDVRRSGGPLCC
jgi:hypothetical protein